MNSENPSADNNGNNNSATNVDNNQPQQQQRASRQQEYVDAGQQQQQQASDKTNLIINYIPTALTSEELRALFSPYGDVMSARVICDPVTAEPKGYGFVKLGTEEQALAARSALDGFRVYNKHLRVTPAMGGGCGGGSRFVPWKDLPDRIRGNVAQATGAAVAPHNRAGNGNLRPPQSYPPGFPQQQQQQQQYRAGGFQQQQQQQHQQQQLSFHHHQQQQTVVAAPQPFFIPSSTPGSVAGGNGGGPAGQPIFYVQDQATGAAIPLQHSPHQPMFVHHHHHAFQQQQPPQLQHSQHSLVDGRLSNSGSSASTSQVLIQVDPTTGAQIGILQQHQPQTALSPPPLPPQLAQQQQTMKNLPQHPNNNAGGGGTTTATNGNGILVQQENSNSALQRSPERHSPLGGSAGSASLNNSSGSAPSSSLGQSGGLLGVASVASSNSGPPAMYVVSQSPSSSIATT